MPFHGSLAHFRDPPPYVPGRARAPRGSLGAQGAHNGVHGSE